MMYYLLTLPQSPMPNEFHVWEQNELDTCCGDVKIIYKNESAEACYQFAKEFLLHKSVQAKAEKDAEDELRTEIRKEVEEELKKGNK